MANRRSVLRIKPGRRHAVAISRHALSAQKLVYIAVANRTIRYARGRSRIAYIGTTRRGVRRIAGSAAKVSKRMLTERGLKELRFYVVTCDARAGTNGWARLERALLVAFKTEFGGPPRGNSQGKNFEWRDEYRFFSHRRLRSVIDHYSKLTW